MKKTRIISIFLSIALVLVMVASCGDGDTTPTTTPVSSPGTTVEPTGGDEVDGDGVMKLPIVDEPMTLSLWRAFTSTVVQTPGDIAAYKEIERLTNIHIDYLLSPSVDATQNFNLLMVSQELPDLLFMQDGTSTTQYNGGHDKAIEDGVFLSLNDYIDRWAPNYKALLDADETTYRQSVTDQGNHAVFVTIQDGNEPAWCGPAIRQDFLDDVGKEMPETYDDLHGVLTAFKNDLNLDIPLSISFLGYNDLTKSLTSGFGIDPSFYNENGTVKFGFIEDGFKDYIALMNAWYSEGLIDSNFYTHTTTYFGVTEDIVNGKIGALEHGMPSQFSNYKASSTDPNFRMIGMPYPRHNASDVAHFRRFNEIVGTTPVALTTNLQDEARIEAAVRWMDFRYSEQGYTLTNYGIKGESYEIVDGQPQFMEVIYNNPDGVTYNDMMAKYADPNGYGSLYIWKRQYVAYSEDQIGSFDTWSETSSGDWVMPPVSLTSEEGEEYSAIFTDIDTYIKESVVKLIIGDTPMSEYDAFVDRINSMDIDRCIDIYQTALNRYLAR